MTEIEFAFCRNNSVMNNADLPNVLANHRGRFPHNHFGWGAANGRLQRAVDKTCLVPAEKAEHYECRSSSIAVSRSLVQQGFRARPLELTIPIIFSGSIHHTVVDVECGQSHLVTGYTPLDPVLKLDPPLELRATEYQAFRTRYQANCSDSLPADPASNLELGNSFYPWHYRVADGWLLVVDFSVSSRDSVNELKLVGSRFCFDQVGGWLTAVDTIMATLQLQRPTKSYAPQPTWREELTANRSQWKCRPDLPPWGNSPVLAALSEDWPKLSCLAEQLASL